MNSLTTGIVSIIGAIITVAIVSVLVSRNSNTPAAIGAAGSFVSRVISAAVSPATHAATNSDPFASAFTMPKLPGLGLSSIGDSVSYVFGGR